MTVAEPFAFPGTLYVSGNAKGLMFSFRERVCPFSKLRNSDII
jgi:hypothetical protein